MQFYLSIIVNIQRFDIVFDQTIKDLNNTKKMCW